MKDAAATAFLVAVSVHAGFLVTVTLLVYPALAGSGRPTGGRPTTGTAGRSCRWWPSPTSP